MAGVKEELAKKAESTKVEKKLTKSMSIADLIKAMEPEIRKALPEVITPERFTRMALSTNKEINSSIAAKILKVEIKTASRLLLKAEKLDILKSYGKTKNKVYFRE